LFEEREKRLEKSGGVEEDHGLRVALQLLERDNLEGFFERAEPARQRNEPSARSSITALRSRRPSVTTISSAAA
jgi:hypothetical protein